MWNADWEIECFPLGTLPICDGPHICDIHRAIRKKNTCLINELVGSYSPSAYILSTPVCTTVILGNAVCVEATYKLIRMKDG